jgi:Domain of unknown function (DUF4399)
MRRSIGFTAAVLVVCTACGGSGDADDAASGDAMGMAAETQARSVEITSPAEGESITGPAVHVTMAPHGFTIVAAGDSTPNSGHLHLFLDRDLSAPGQAIPVEPGAVVHLGTGTSEYTFENVAAGDHTLIAVVGDAVHIPLEPWVVDTVHFTVR